MENQENKIFNENSFVNNDESSFGNREINEYLLETSKWGKFLAIVGFVGMGLMVIFAIIMMTGFSELSKATYGEGFPMATFGFVYLAIGALYFFPIYYLYQFSAKIKRGLQSNDLSIITYGFENLKSLFKFMGIVTIVVLSIYGLMLLIAIPMVLLLKP